MTTQQRPSSFFQKTTQNNTKDHPFSSRGRFNRLSYMAWLGFGQILLVLSLFGISLFMGILNLNTFNINEHTLRHQSFVFGFSMAFVLLFFAYLNWVFTIRRLHDLNQSGWLCLLYFVPLLNVFFAFYLLVARGSEQFNQYGAPRPTAAWEKMLAWFMIVLSLLSLISISSTVSYLMGTGDIEAPQQLIQRGTAYF